MPNFALNNWMGSIKDDVRLNQVVMPATHDSGMHYQSWGSAYSVINPLAWLAKGGTALAATIDDAKSGRSVSATHDNFVTQLYDIGGQLNYGARQFDLRMTENWGDYKAFHGAAGLALLGMRRYGQSWKSICANIATFMKANMSEVIVLKMDKQDKGDKKLVKMLSDALFEADVHYLHLAQYPKLRYKYVDRETIGHLRGRVILCGKKKFLDAAKAAYVRLHPIIELCEWAKNEAGDAPPNVQPDTQLPRNEYPVYLLLGSSNAGGALDDKEDPIVKQRRMKTIFARQVNRTVGMRGIWFNTYSFLRDIRKYSLEVWKQERLVDRNRLWLEGNKRQNVASVDFLDEEKGNYIVGKNPDEVWKA